MGLGRWHRLRDQDTHLLWRIGRRKARRVQDVLPDGSYLARIEANKHSKAAGTVKAPSAPVRVIEYRAVGQVDVVRLIIRLTGHEKCPAEELAVLYGAQRAMSYTVRHGSMPRACRIRAPMCRAPRNAGAPTDRRLWGRKRADCISGSGPAPRVRCRADEVLRSGVSLGGP
ncbi:hypothetical protein QFZ22_001094 [Streptomyces canus]|uniref:Transposase n=1 Tax=Streptomyces canus TaxID=58343 RepID=A0AAW8F5N9_9ACTN|nr:hypothetical protein [Streptomyces canus]MDQ0905109.1 hypothetical protein [Streptomyces canus]